MTTLAHNVLRVPLLKYHDEDDHVTHIWQLRQVCITNGENTHAHKLQYFPNTLRRQDVNWIIRYEIKNPVARWGATQQAFVEWFSMVRNEGQTIISFMKHSTKRNMNY